MISAYFVFFSKKPEEPNLTSSSPQANTLAGIKAESANAIDSQLSQDFLAVLLSIKNINLDDSLFSNNAFLHLKDTTIVLVQDGTEGRPNPFAPIGSENTVLLPEAIRFNFDNSNATEDLSVKVEELEDVKIPSTQ